MLPLCMVLAIRSINFSSHCNKKIRSSYNYADGIVCSMTHFFHLANDCRCVGSRSFYEQLSIAT